jgi:SnoaL-like protein
MPRVRFALVASLALTLLALAPAGAAQDCPRHLKSRTAAEVLADHRAALTAGNLDLAMCDFAEDAVVIHDGGIDTGLEQIRASLAFLQMVFGGAVPTVTEEITAPVINDHTFMVRLRFELTLPFGSIPDGLDTYIITKGRIVAQTAHGVLIPPAP